MNTRFTKIFAFVLWASVAGTLFSYSGTATMEGSSPQIRVQPTAGLMIENLRTRPQSDELLISGQVERAFGWSTLTRGHVCIDVRSADGKLISHEQVRLTPSGHPRVLGAWIGRSSFATTVAAPANATITLSAHSGGRSSCLPS